MGFGLNWGAPEVGDIVWCIVPYVDHLGRTSQVRHPALVLAVDAHAKAVQVVVVGGATDRAKRARKSTDLLIQTTDAWFKETGLNNDTVFHFERRYTLPYTAAHFVSSVHGTPKLGFLSAKHPQLVERVRKALRATT